MIQELLAGIARHLENSGLPYMVIGGQAVLLYGNPRLTMDIDITLGVDVGRYKLVERVCTAMGLKLLPENPADFAGETNVLPARDINTGIRIDLIFSFTPYERQAIDRAVNVSVGGQKVSFASPEDVIIHKMFAGRPVDIEDVKGILLKHRERLDIDYLVNWLMEFDRIAEQEGILERFRTLLKET